MTRRLTTMRCAPLAVCALLANAAPGAAQEPAPVRMEHFTLENGLAVVLAPGHASQTVAVDVAYAVGSRDEQPGRTGFAHLFEHMMFQGSANVPRGEHMALVGRNGGNANGFTTEDRTEYFAVLPSDRLALGLWLEADRMRSLAVTEENFTNQRQAVQEEMRMRVENQPYAGSVTATVYGAVDSAACHPYAHRALGSMDDLNRATTADVQAFFRQYYVPNNATLVVTGDFDPAEARRLVRAYFADIARGPAAPPVVCTPRFATGGGVRHLHDPRAALPMVLHAYPVPAYAERDYPAVALLASVLGQGNSARLNRALVRGTRSAAAAFAQMGGAASGATGRMSPRRGPQVLLVGAVANGGVSADSVHAQLRAEVDRIAREGVTDEELRRARNTFRAEAIRGRQQPLFLAEDIQIATLFLGSPQAVNTDLARFQAVTADDVRRAAAQYLRADNALAHVISSQPAP
jgi:predicted Zn-dependent peptidase